MKIVRNNPTELKLDGNGRMTHAVIVNDGANGHGNVIGVFTDHYWAKKFSAALSITTAVVEVTIID